MPKSKVHPHRAHEKGPDLTFHFANPVHFFGKSGTYRDVKIVLHRSFQPFVVFEWRGEAWLGTPTADNRQIMPWAPSTYEVEPVGPPGSGKSHGAKVSHPAKPAHEESRTAESQETQAQRTPDPEEKPAESPSSQVRANQEEPTPAVPPAAAPEPEAPAKDPSPADRANQNPKTKDDRPSSGILNVLRAIDSRFTLAGMLDEQLDQVARSSQIIDRKLEEFVENHDSILSVAAANVAADVVGVGRAGLDFGKSMIDTLRVGQGMTEGGWGYGKDAMRIANIAAPAIRGLAPLAVRLSAALGASRALNRARSVFIRRLAQVYQEQIAYLQREFPNLTPSQIGTRADAAAKAIIQDLFPNYTILLEEETGITKGILSKEPGITLNIDLVVKELELAIDLKKSEAATRIAQQLAHLIHFETLLGYEVWYIYGHF